MPIRPLRGAVQILASVPVLVLVLVLTREIRGQASGVEGLPDRTLRLQLGFCAPILTGRLIRASEYARNTSNRSMGLSRLVRLGRVALREEALYRLTSKMRPKPTLSSEFRGSHQTPLGWCTIILVGLEVCRRFSVH